MGFVERLLDLWKGSPSGTSPEEQGTGKEPVVLSQTGQGRVALRVWANHRDVNNFVCADARLRDKKDPQVPRTEDQTNGQANWDVGINFQDLRDLADQLSVLTIPAYATPDWKQRPIRPGDVARLALNTHAAPGCIRVRNPHEYAVLRRYELVVNCEPPFDLDARTAYSHHYGELQRIGTYLNHSPGEDGAVVLLMGCIAGKGEDGVKLLLALSNIWPNCRVVGFCRIGWTHPPFMERRTQGCTEPGMRLTDYDEPSQDPSQEAVNFDRWENLAALPWAHESSEYAHIALNSHIVKVSQSEPHFKKYETAPASPPNR